MSTTYGLHRAALLNCDGTAVVFEDRRRTFAELADRVARLAGALKALGIAKGDRVAVLSLNQDRYIELFLASPGPGPSSYPSTSGGARWKMRMRFATAVRSSCSSTPRLRRWAAKSLRGSARCRSFTPTKLRPLARRRCRTMKVCSRPPRRSRMRKRETTSLPASSIPAARPGAPKASC